MKEMMLSATLVRVNDRTLYHYCLACDCLHPLYINPPGELGPYWTYNYNHERPTLSPSVKHQGYGDHGKPVNCHYFIVDGTVQFCADSGHAYAGKTILLPPIPDRYLMPETE